jgi:sugar phosphate permease
MELNSDNQAGSQMSPLLAAPDSSGQNKRLEQLQIGFLAISILMAFILYVHRIALSEIVKHESFQQAMGADSKQLGKILGAFFFTYALFQIPAGWASDRFGGRVMLTCYILAWSILTGLTGLVTSVGGLLVIRLLCGVAQAGAYPTSAAIVRRWFGLQHRGVASGLISMGGRIGGATAGILTFALITSTGSWRASLIILGIVGGLVAMIYWRVVRDLPPQPVESTLRVGTILDSNTRSTKLTEMPALLLTFCCSRSLSLAAFVQFSVNIGWAFLATWLPTYLTKVKSVDPKTSATMVMIILACGIPAQFFGGYLSDKSVKRLGLRWGRVFPVACATAIAAIAYWSCMFLDHVWAIVICCGVVSAMTDIANPSFWAFTQDVGGKNTATILGWCNMWGNFGATLIAVCAPYLMELGQKHQYGMAPVFLVCGAAYLACTIAALGMNATKPIQLRQP